MIVSGGPVVQLLLVAVSVLGLWIGARLLVDAAVRLARQFGLSQLVIGLTVVAVGTSLPEFAVSIGAALDGLGDIAVGNLLGSNVYNLAVVLGVVSIIRVIPIRRSLVRRDGFVLLAATAAGGLALLDGTVTRIEGILLAGTFVGYTSYLLVTEHGETAQTGTSSVTRSLPERVTFRGRDVAFIVAGLVIVLASGDLLVVAASKLARGAGVSEWVIGGTIVAAGTSTPEFAVSLFALRRGSLGVSVGNVVGSNVINVTAVLGVASVIEPLSATGDTLTTLAWLVVVSLAVVAALWTGRELSRPEGGVLVGSEAVRWIVGLLG